MAEERLKPIALHQEMQRSYLEYAMSVIVGRALPDVRDGLKPVQRRILFAMHELGLTPERPYRKCARVVGDVLGKYHPHGDQAVYDALVRLVQTFSSRFPVLDGHGNFGSVDDDPPAAMRYTEARLAPIANEALLEEIGSETVDFSPNFDGSHQEPSVLPAQLPFLLLNGCSGIAVGMATSIPPHNLNEIVDGLIALIKKPDLSNEKLLKYIPGPDFPTGGEVLIGSGIKETYEKGKGSIPMRGVSHYEEIVPGKGKHKRSAIVITELPYQLSKSGWIEKLADQVNESKINGIADIRDESDREGMRIVVELRRDADQEQVKRELERKTSFQNNFGAILLAIVHGQPKQLSLKELLVLFIEYRELTLLKRTKFAHRKITERLNILEGLIKALNKLSDVIKMIESAKDSSDAKRKLIVKLNINDKQAESILSMPLRRLTSLEQENIHNELKELSIKKVKLEELINNRDILLETLINELKKLKQKYGNKRKTKLIEGGDQLIAEKNASQRPNAELQRKQALEALSNDGKIIIQNDLQVKIVSPQILGRLHLEQSSDLGNECLIIKCLGDIETKPKIIVITENGKVALVRWEFAGQQPGSIEKFLPGGLEGEKIKSILSVPNNEHYTLGLLSDDGKFKRLAIEEVLDLSGRAATILKLKEGVKLKRAIVCYPKGNLILITDIGRILKLPINNESLPIKGKVAQGPLTMRLLPGETLIGCISSNSEKENSLIIGTEQGKIFKLNIDDIRECERCDFGQMIVELKKDINLNDKIINICRNEHSLSYITNQNRQGRIICSELNESLEIKTNKDEKIVELIPLTIAR